MVNMSVPTINEYHKNYNNLDVSYDNLYYKDLANLTSESKAILLNECVLDNYSGDLAELVVSKTLTPEEQRKYPWHDSRQSDRKRPEYQNRQPGNTPDRRTAD